MPKLFAKKRILPDAGRHLCKLVSVEEIENQFYNPAKDKEDKKKRLAWTFVYDSKPEMEIRAWSSFSLSIWKGKKSTALLLYEALLNKTLTKEQRETGIDTNELLGKNIYLTVKQEKDGDTSEVNAKIIDIEPVQPKK